ncbi:MAG: hypothetical protein HKO07_02075 [Pseudomonadales bacterium]|nr:hypothetical protein [Pseudomonadales bacterium]
MRIQIRNSTAPLAAQAESAGQHNGIALRNIRARLASIYSDKDGHNPAALTLAAEENCFVVRLDIPLRPPAAN